VKKGLPFSIAVVVLAGAFASQNPDGLEKVAEILGFAGKATNRWAIMFAYRIHFLGTTKFSAILAGICGVGIIYGLFWVCAGVFSRLAGKKSTVA